MGLACRGVQMGLAYLGPGSGLVCRVSADRIQGRRAAGVAAGMDTAGPVRMPPAAARLAAHLERLRATGTVAAPRPVGARWGYPVRLRVRAGVQPQAEAARWEQCL